MEVDEELEFHMTMAVRDLVRAGHSPDEAQRLATERFGSLEGWRAKLMNEDTKRDVRVRRADRWETFAAEANRLFRGLAGAPVFTLGVVLTLAIGIGANATMFGIVDRLLLRPPEGVEHAEHVRLVWQEQKHESAVDNIEFFSYPAFEHIQNEVPGFSDVSAYAFRSLVSGHGQDAEALRVGFATSGYFSTLGTRPAAGRLFVQQEGEAGSAPNVVVLSNALWHSRFGGSENAIGQTMLLGGHQMTIIGVLPEGVGSLQLERVDAWAPLAAMPILGLGESWKSNRYMHWLRIVGRVRQDVPAVELEQQLTQALLSNERAMSEIESQPVVLEVRGLTYGVQAAAGPEEATSVTVSRWLAGMSVILLLIACANVANLLLVRGMRRQKETALRVALGVNPGRLVLNSLAEALVLAVAGGILALLLTRWASALVRTVLFPEMSWPDRLLDIRVALITSTAILVTTLIAGLAPAFRSLRVDVLPSLQGGHRAGTFQRSRLRAALLVTQSALCVLLLVGAGLFVSSLNRALDTDLGYDPASVALVELPLPRSTIPREEWPLAVQTVRETLQRLPQVRSAALTNSVPRWSTTAYDVSVPGVGSGPAEKQISLVHSVSHDYLETMGLQLVAGRFFSESESRSHLAVINESAARKFWPGENALGSCVVLGDQVESEPCNTIVGIVADMKWRGISESTQLQVFVPHEMEGQTSPLLLVGMSHPLSEDIGSLENEMRQAAMSAEPRLDWTTVRSLTSVLSPDYRSWRLGATMFSAFGLLALVLASVGLYSAISYMVAQRTHDMGVRRALGASRWRVARLVVQQGVTVVGAGIAIGLAVAIGAAGRLEGLLFEVAPRDPVILAFTALALLVVSALACAVPALRAARVSPMEALQE